MIDWLNPSNDIVAAKQAGYNAGVAELENRLDEKDAEIDRLLEILTLISAEPSFDPNRTRAHYTDQVVKAYSRCRQLATEALKE